MQIYEITQGKNPLQEVSVGGVASAAKSAVGAVGAGLSSFGSGVVSGLSKAGGATGEIANQVQQITDIDTAQSQTGDTVQQQSQQIANKMVPQLSKQMTQAFKNEKMAWQADNAIVYGSPITPAQRTNLEDRITQILQKAMRFNYRQLNKLVSADTSTQLAATDAMKAIDKGIDEYVNASVTPTGSGSALTNAIKEISLFMASALALKQLRPKTK